MRKYLLFLLLPLLVHNTVFAQSSKKNVPSNWFLLDPETDSVQGVSAEKTYNTWLNNMPSKTILVAVIDSGIDIEHEDLKSVIWTNEREIAGNGVDDDLNGYIDDAHGWNFIGGKSGNVNADTYELTRECMRLQKKFASLDTTQLSKKLAVEFSSYKKIKDKYQKLKVKNEQQYGLYYNIYRNLRQSVDTMKAHLKVDSLTLDLVKRFESNDVKLLFAKGFILNMYKNAGEDADIEEVIAEVKKGVDYYEVIVKYGYNQHYDSRLIVGDNYLNLYERGYGNNDVKGPDPTHGTHVAGIIAADRKNDIGIKGIADNVKIMPIRAVPNGDERDKDIANAILYAVDNGAKIINMSFGKSFSPEKEAVDKAVRYAEMKGVLLIHAAGNNGDNIDVDKNFPTKKYLTGKEAKNWIEVGANSWGANEAFVGSFSNYGKKMVSLFAPGVEIYSTVPGNQYKNESGTSMASPTAAGVAALVWSYFPDLTMGEVKDILLKSTRKFDNLKVMKPGTKELVLFNELSSTGGIVNAYEAMKMAKNVKRKKIE